MTALDVAAGLGLLFGSLAGVAALATLGMVGMARLERATDPTVTQLRAGDRP